MKFKNGYFHYRVRIMMTSANGNIFFVTGPLCEEFTGHQWLPRRSPVNSPHKGQWRGAFMFPLICAWIYVWANNREVGDLRCHPAHYGVTDNPFSRIMIISFWLVRCGIHAFFSAEMADTAYMLQMNDPSQPCTNPSTYLFSAKPRQKLEEL